MIRPFTGERKAPRRIVTFDCEWYPKTYEFRCASTFDGEQYEFYDNPTDLLQGLCSRSNRGAYVYSHFGGAADEQFLLQPWLRSEFRIDAVFSGGSMVFVKVTRDRDCWYLLDSYWTLRRPLGDIARSIGRKKLDDWKCPGACAHPASDKCIFYAPDRVVREYNLEDSVILWHAMSQFQDEMRELGAELKATAASNALDLFRRVYLDGSVKTVGWVNELGRGAYIASRVEVFRPEIQGPAWSYDVNSSFPWSMTQPTPGNLERTTKDWSGDDLALVKARVEVPEQYVPPLAYRRLKDGAIYHPTGSWLGWFTGVDLRALLETGGRIVKLFKTLLFERRDELAAYVYELYERRKKETDPFRRDLYKLLMNGLYGKFGESPEKRTLVIEGGRFTLTRAEKYVPHRWLPIGATITARSRQLLGKYLRMAGHVAYADTDSVFTNNPDMPTGTELGELKREKEIRTRAVFFRPKFYQLDGEGVKAKGFTRLSPDQFDGLMRGEPVEVVRMQRVREKLFQMIRSGAIDADGFVLQEHALHPCDGSYVKQLNATLRPKRAPDGESNTRPWTVEELR